MSTTVIEVESGEVVTVIRDSGALGIGNKLQVHAHGTFKSYKCISIKGEYAYVLLDKPRLPGAEDSGEPK